MIVCIAEKPSVARDIASIVGATRSVVRQGIGYMEGNGYQVTWTFGHLCTLKEPHDYDPRWKPWSLSSLPIIPARFGIKVIDNEHYKNQLEQINQLLQGATMVINCGDAGQEGELIQRWVLQKCGCQVPVKRLWISSLTDDAIREGFANLKDESQYRSLYEAGLARAIGDWLLGMNATRFYTLRYREAQVSGQPLSIGRVQTPTLALIVQRAEEIEGFVPQTYWELKTRYRGVIFSADKGRYDTREKADKALLSVQDVEMQITGIKKKDGKELAPRLFDLTSLQVACNKKWGLSAEETLQIAQKLYERKLITYPRVDTTYLSDDIYPRVQHTLLGLVNYRPLVEPLLGQPLRKSKKTFDSSKVTDHHAIIPTGQPIHGLDDREMKVFDLVARHFIAAFYPDCAISTTSVVGKVGRVTFKVSGREIISPGWRVVFDVTSQGQGQEMEEEDAEDNTTPQLPPFEVGEHGAHEPLIKEKKTHAPKPYTEATLLRAMETAGKLVEQEELREVMKENGIGRPSTRANIIETLFKRGYIVKEKKSQLHPTATGRSLIRVIDNDLLKSAELTGQWEYKLRQIERGELEGKTFVEELKALTCSLVRKVLSPPPSSAPTVEGNASPTPPVCPVCHKGYIIRGKTSYGCSAYREGCDYRINFEEYEAIQSKEPQTLF